MGVSAQVWLQQAVLASCLCPPALQGPFCHDRWLTGSLTVPWWHHSVQGKARILFPSCLAWKTVGPLLHLSPLGDGPHWALSPPGLAVSREKGEHQHVSLCRTYINISYCFYFLLSMEDIQVWRAGSLAELVLLRFQMLSSLVEEQQG